MYQAANDLSKLRAIVLLYQPSTITILDGLWNTASPSTNDRNTARLCLQENQPKSLNCPLFGSITGAEYEQIGRPIDFMQVFVGNKSKPAHVGLDSKFYGLLSQCFLVGAFADDQVYELLALIRSEACNRAQDGVVLFVLMNARHCAEHSFARQAKFRFGSLAVSWCKAIRIDR